MLLLLLLPRLLRNPLRLRWLLRLQGLAVADLAADVVTRLGVVGHGVAGEAIEAEGVDVAVGEVVGEAGVVRQDEAYKWSRKSVRVVIT